MISSGHFQKMCAPTTLSSPKPFSGFRPGAVVLEALDSKSDNIEAFTRHQSHS